MRWNCVYLHGFNSSERSQKATEWGTFLRQKAPEARYYVPRLAPTPFAAFAQIRALMADLSGPTALIGSSLGGFMAARISELYRCPAVLINPAVYPQQLLVDYLGWQHNPYTQRRYQLLPCHMQQLTMLNWQGSRGEQLQVWLQQGDEVLDYRQAAALFSSCECHIAPGGDHSYRDFSGIMPHILDFMRSQLAAMATS